MTWIERLREAAYTPPSGKRMTFSYENVSLRFKKRTSAFEFPDRNGTFIQDLGASGRKYPMRVFIWGADYDLRAREFEDALYERGVGKLEHPIYGVVDVVPFGEIKRRDDLKTAGNQATIEVTFFETTGVSFPSSNTDKKGQVLRGIDGLNTAAAQAFDDSQVVATAVSAAKFKSGYVKDVAGVRLALAPVAATVDEISGQFDAIYESINLGIDVLIDSPTTLAFQTLLLIQAPARAGSYISDRLEAYRNLLGTMINGDGAAGTKADFLANDLFVAGYVSAMALSVVNATFDTKMDALEAAEDILTSFQAASAWKESGALGFGVIDTGEVYQELQQIVATTAGFLVDISFTLKQERTLTLDRDRTVIDLVAELYGAVDSKIDFFIKSNSLTGDEILTVPRGRRVVYYI